MVRSQRVMLLLGAGASSQFGVPITRTLLKGYLRDAKRPRWKVRRAQQVLKTIKEYGFDPSLENLLMVLDANADPQRLLEHFGPILAQHVSKTKLRRIVPLPKDTVVGEDIREWVFLKCYVSGSRIVSGTKLIDKIGSYYDRIFVGIKQYFSLPLLSNYVQRYPPLHVFTTNFDNCIELFCRRQNIPLYDGFDNRPQGGYKFDHTLYSDSLTKTRLKLYKIHGTVRYVKNPDGEFDELTVAPLKDTIEINGKSCKPDLVYPGSYQYSSESPRLELLYLMKEQIRIADRIVVIGYSFRDQHITTVFREGLSENPKSRLILCSKHARQIIKKNLPFAKNQSIPVSISAKNLDPLKHFPTSKVPR